jgi:hypothetical protein
MNNRKLEFRAYDKKFGVMLPNVAVFDNNNIVVVDYLISHLYGDRQDERNDDGVEDAGPEHVCITGDLEIMQYTGQDYSDGSPIYEGDIVKHGESIRTVEQLDSRWTLVSKNRETGILLSFSKPVKLGNLFENPELLS